MKKSFLTKIPANEVQPGDFLLINPGQVHPITSIDRISDVISYSLYEGCIKTDTLEEVWQISDGQTPGFLPIEWRGFQPNKVKFSRLAECRGIEFFRLTKFIMSAKECEIVRINLPYLAKPDFLPSPWSYLSDETKKCVIVMARECLGGFSLDRLARHAIACEIERNGGHVHECVANKIWGQFFPDKDLSRYTQAN